MSWSEPVYSIVGQTYIDQIKQSDPIKPILPYNVVDPFSS